MSTKLYPLLGSVGDTGRGTNTARADGTAVGWQPCPLSPTPGSSLRTLTTNTVAGATNGVEIGANSTAREFISPPLAADSNISGTITFNVWGAENNMSANVGFQVIIERLDSQLNVVSTVINSERGVELAVTTDAVNNWTGTPTSTNFNRGDRIRVRILGNDGGGTMASGFTFATSTDMSGAVDGDTWIQFNENLTFETTDPSIFDSGARVSAGNMGDVTADTALATPFKARGTLTTLAVWLAKTAAPTDNLIIEIQTDSSGFPSGTVVATIATVAGSSLTTTQTQNTYSSLAIALTVGTQYWVVFRRSGANDTVNFYNIGTNTNSTFGAIYNNTSWTNNFTLSITATFLVTTLYLTDTTSPVVPASGTGKEAWTSRGSGSVNAVTNTVTGWASPIQVTASGGGSVIEWYTKALRAFTLGGRAKCNVRALDAGTSTVRLEIAVCNGDGSSPVVWGAANTTTQGASGAAGDLTGTDADNTVYVSGDDVAVTAGQRLRIRIYVDDTAGTAMVGSSTTTVSYAGTTGGAAGDTYVILPAAILENTKSLIMEGRLRRSLVRR